MSEPDQLPAALELELQQGEGVGTCPALERLSAWAGGALAGRLEEPCSLGVRIVGDGEMTQLNRQYRGQEKTTNVLAFPCGLRDETGRLLLGDLVISQPQVQLEAAQRGMAEEAHWAHLVIHGVLHLLGYDHEAAADAAIMESLETAALARFGIPDPYREDS